MSTDPLFTDGNAVACQECGVEDDGLHPAGQEADLLTEGIAQVSDHTAGLGDHDGHFCEGQSAQQRSDTAEDPYASIPMPGAPPVAP